jgi:hypothetical protein
MKMKRTTVTWEKTVSVVLYVPEDMDDHSIRFIAENTADDIDREGWDVSWETHVSRAEAVEVPDEACAVVARKNRYGGTFSVPVENSVFAKDDVMVADDERETFVNPTDATWWLARSESNDEEKP